jgi:purine-binding chemotaxis protein CheW
METLSPVAAAEPGQYLGLFIGGEEYALGILRVKEILQFDGITHVPGTPPSIRGVINVRGNVVPVVDLAVKFGLPPTAITSRTCVVIVEVALDGSPTVMGVMADSVSQVMDLLGDDIQPAPTFGTRVHVDYLLGMGRADRRFSLILDIDRVLSASELVIASSLEEPEGAPEAP